MTEEYIQQLAKKFLDGTATEEEKQILHAWYDQHNTEEEEGQIIFLQSPETGQDFKQRIHSKLKRARQSPAIQGNSQWMSRFLLWSGVAAAILVGVFLLLDKTSITDTAFQIVRVPLGETRHVKLSDGSVIWLNAGSVLTYPKSFSGKTREVVLQEGEAFFDIVHLSGKPFIVHAKTLDITVFGTSFNVKAYENDPAIKVAVRTGKVGVKMRNKPEKPALMLLPTEQAVVRQNTARIHVNEISHPAIAPWKDNRMVFEDEPLAEVFFALERKYKQHIVVEKANLLQEKITVTLDNQPMTDVLKVLGFSKNFTYSPLNDSTIVIR